MEAFRRLTGASNDSERDSARRALEIDVKTYPRYCGYIIPGETAESAILFLPFSLFTKLTSNYPRCCCQPQSPRLYGRAGQSDAVVAHSAAICRMRGCMGLDDQTQVDLMMKDVHRLEDRVGKLATFSQVERDISDIQTSTQNYFTR